MSDRHLTLKSRILVQKLIAFCTHRHATDNQNV